MDTMCPSQRQPSGFPQSAHNHQHTRVHVDMEHRHGSMADVVTMGSRKISKKAIKSGAVPEDRAEEWRVLGSSPGANKKW